MCACVRVSVCVTCHSGCRDSTPRVPLDWHWTSSSSPRVTSYSRGRASERGCGILLGQGSVAEGGPRELWLSPCAGHSCTERDGIWDNIQVNIQIQGNIQDNIQGNI